MVSDMQDILGTDINGRPLRVGDEVVLLKSVSGFTGRQCIVIGKFPCPCGGVEIDIKSDFSRSGWKSAYGESLRKLHSDHRPADESFGEMMGKLAGMQKEGLRR